MTARTHFFSSAALLASLAFAPVATAQAVDDLVTFGGNAHIRPGQVVDDLVTLGGDALVEGEVRGDALTMGGDLIVAETGRVRGDGVTFGGDFTVQPGGRVDGDVGTMGGNVTVRPGAHTGGDIDAMGGHIQIDRDAGANHRGREQDRGSRAHSPAMGPARGFFGHVGHWVGRAVSHVVSYALLFILGLVLMGATRERLDGLQVVIVRQPWRALGMGIGGIIASIIAFVVLCVTVVGIPAALLLAIAVPLAAYVGLAASASVLGAAISVAQIKGKPVLELAAGVAILFVASLIPVVGAIAVTVAALVGLGALVITHFRPAVELPPGPEPAAAGPYRTSAA